MPTLATNSTYIAPFTQLINIKCGPGAAVLPAEVTRIHMDFAIHLKGGHMGARFVVPMEIDNDDYSEKAAIL